MGGTMNLDRDGWIDLVWTSLRDIPTGDVVDKLESAWRDHQSREKPVAAIYGAYDAGKSSLLKRLLFEDGVAVPSEITVSGRRETFSVDEITGSTWTFRDSPGFAGGNDEHDIKALESLDLADLLIWVLPPQLVTSNKETFDAIVTGERFGVTGDHVTDSLLAVISRIDEAGIDPSENPEGFRSLCSRKQAEFKSLLDAIGSTSPRWGVHPISADPYQSVGNEQPDASLYEMGSGWDGVEELREALTQAQLSVPELRTLSGYRFASHAITSFTQMVKVEQALREEAIATCENELERVALLRTSLDALRRKCEADLHRLMEDELLSAIRIGTVSAAEALQTRLVEALDQWSEQAYAEFENLAASADQEASERGRSPAMRRLRELILEMGAAESDSTKTSGEGKAKKRASQFSRAFRDGFKAYARVDLSMSLEEAAKFVREWKQSGLGWDEFRKAHNVKNFPTEEVAKKASKYVKWAEALDSVGPIMEQLGPLLYDIGSDVLSAIEAEKKAHQRQKLRDALRGAAAEVEDEAKTGMGEMTGTFSEWLDQQEKIHLPAKQALAAQLSELIRFEAELASLLRQRPT
ncbi:GTPase [Synechococcus sp. CCY 0621]|uniref:GTPase n=1 Tax=Synechococcus sp. CCY 0621 TaxID=2815603 RepID=UPI001C239791|nr:GTPase [Synechococcus sp. CCY 0621]